MSHQSILSTRDWEDFYRTFNVRKPSPFAKFCRSFIPVKSQIVDLGCGNGRDSYYLAHRHSVIGIDNAYENYDSINPYFIKLKFEYIHSLNIKFNIAYLRFTLHAITEDLEDHLLKWIKENIHKKGMILIEARSNRDKSLRNTHYRRPLDYVNTMNKLKALNFIITFASEKKGFAKYKNENPIIIRIIANV